MSCLHWLCCFTLAVHQAHSEWRRGSPNLPEANYYSVVGYHAQTDTFSILGGVNTAQDLIEFNMADLSIEYTNSTYSPFSGYDIQCGGQCYTQLNDILYMTNRGGTNLHAYNLDTKAFTANIAPSSMFATVFSSACLAASGIHSKLFVVGGFGGGTIGAVNKLQVYDMLSETWSYGPNMQRPRKNVACIIHPGNGKLFAIGGYSDTSSLTTVEYIDINGTDGWSYTQQYLQSYRSGSRAIAVGEQVWLISDTLVHVIHADYNITVHADALVVGVSYSAAIAVGTTPYVFAGITNKGVEQKVWQYYELPTSSPSAAPSSSTDSPSVMPSAAPSSPSSAPTQDPTSLPGSSSGVVRVQHVVCLFAAFISIICMN